MSSAAVMIGVLRVKLVENDMLQFETFSEHKTRIQIALQYKFICGLWVLFGWCKENFHGLKISRETTHSVGGLV